MEEIRAFPHSIAAIFIALLLLIRPVYSQNNSICSASMLQSFSSCIGFLSGGGSGGSPTRQCCDSLKDVMSSGRDCLCLIITGGVGFQVPIDRTLAASLPRACKTSGVPIECKALPGAPIPAPGPTILNSPPPSWLPEPTPPAFTPPGNDAPGAGDDGSGTFTPPGFTPPDNTGGFPVMTPPGVRPDLSAANSPRFSCLNLIVLLGAIAFKYF